MPKTFQEIVAEAKPHIKEIDNKTLSSWLEQGQNDNGQPFQLVDIREESEVARGTIPGAHPISRGVLEMELQDLVPDDNKCIVLYCGGGNRSALAAVSAQNMGYSNVYSLAGGYKRWIVDIGSQQPAMA